MRLRACLSWSITLRPDPRPILLHVDQHPAALRGLVEPAIELADVTVPIVGKLPLAIEARIGKRPILAAGNSDGDFQMLEWTTAGKGPRLGLIVHHTDGEREFAYDRDSHVGQLDRGLDEAAARGWVLIDMKQDWVRIWPAGNGP